VADYAEEISDQPPPALKLAWRMKRWGQLPKAGGLLEQPLAIMTQVEMALHTFEAFTARKAAESAVQFAETHPSWAEFCYEVDQWQRN
jgi:hypothetical protein